MHPYSRSVRRVTQLSARDAAESGGTPLVLAPTLLTASPGSPANASAISMSRSHVRLKTNSARLGIIPHLPLLRSDNSIHRGYEHRVCEGSSRPCHEWWSRRIYPIRQETLIFLESLRSSARETSPRCPQLESVVDSATQSSWMAGLASTNGDSKDDA